MKISFQPNIYHSNFVQNSSFEPLKTEKSSDFQFNENFSAISTDNLKANFCPNFGRYRTIDRVLLENKKTLFLEPANIVKETYGDTSIYKAMIHRQEAGYMNIKFDSIIPEDNFLVMEADNNIPEVTHIRSLMGEDYAGIGTSLLHTAVQESKKYGRNGAIWLQAETGYAYQSSKYRSNESPIPFYYKLGFIAPDEKVHEEITKCLESRKYNLLPEEAILLLPSDRVHILEEYFDEHFKMD